MLIPKGQSLKNPISYLLLVQRDDIRHVRMLHIETLSNNSSVIQTNDETLIRGII